MKKITLVIASFLVAGIINAQTTDAKIPVGTTEQPAVSHDISQVLQFNEENHDFGQIPNGKPVEFDVVMKNISKDSVKLDNVKVGCGCTTPKYEQGKSYGPGEVFKITLGFNGYATGPFEKYADINFGDGLSKHVKFHGVGYKVPDTPAPVNSAIEKLKGA